jgi:pyrroloquinoline quinone (PQQ) biosynthesis protein C
MFEVMTDPDERTMSPGHPLDYPQLRHCTFIGFDDDEPLTMVVGQDYYAISEEFGDRDTFFRVKSRFDGRHTIDQIAHATGVATEDVVAIVETFTELGLMQQREPLDLIPVPGFIAQIDASCEMWARQLSYHRLYAQLLRHECRREVFTGLLIETYHYVRSAPQHIATAIAGCGDDKVRHLLSQYFVDEWNHAPLILETLRQLGVNTAHVEAAHPTIGAMSLTHMLNAVGQAGTLNYLTATSLFEARDNDADAAEEAMRQIAKGYDFDPAALDSLFLHMRADIEMNHASLLSSALDPNGYVPAEAAHKAVNWLHDLKHAFDQFHDGVLLYYSDTANYLPRLNVDYFSL